MIYHITTETDWKKAIELKGYAPASLAAEGFIHTSQEHQVQGVLERFYKDLPDLILLYIDETKLNVPLKYEKANDIDDDFPHIYGPVNIDAVIKTSPIPQTS